MKTILFVDAKESNDKRDNANIDTDAPMGIMLKVGTETAKKYADEEVIPAEFVKADKENWMHIHDKDFSLITFNCCQIDLLKLFKGGFSTGHGHLREPNSIRSYASLACIAIQANQNDMFGGQAVNAFDFAMAEGVRKSFQKAIKNKLKEASVLLFPLVNEEINFDEVLKNYTFKYSEKNTNKEELKKLKEILEYCKINYTESQKTKLATKIYHLACIDTEEETKQAMEAVVHNLNTLHSRAGAQVPFSSLNYGMDTSSEGRLVIRELLNSIDRGLGNGETPIFPISVFLLKKGVNYDLDDPNYDLFKLACKVSAKRLFPNFESLDATYNLQYYKPNDYNSFVATMGCRTRVMSNVNGLEVSGGRGNFSFVTINLPKIAIESKGDISKFYQIFDKYITLAHDYLLHRLHIIENKKAYNFPFLMGQGVWLDSEKLSPNDSIKEVLKHASLSIGFCGLAECLKEMTGHHQGESEESQKLGLEIVSHLRNITDKYTEEEHRNWSTFATPAESCAGKFQKANQKEYGVIEGVTDKEYMTNSFHVPVYYPIKAIDKIKIEAPYHELCNAGHISYIELDGDTSKNVTAFETIVRAMHDNNMGYFSVNHPVDRDPVCGYTGIINNVCPKCGRTEKEHKRKITVRRKKEC